MRIEGDSKKTLDLILSFLAFSAPFIKLPEKIFMFPENLGQPSRFAYNYFPQLYLLTEIYMVNY